MKKIVVFGDTSFAGIVAEYINSTSIAEVVAFTLDSAFIKNRDTFEGLPLITFDKIEKQYNPADFEMLITISSVSKMKHLNSIKFYEAKNKGYELFSFVHPTSFVANSATIGENVLIFPHVVVEPRAIINNGVFVRSAAYVSHETEIGAFSYLAPRTAFSGKIKTGNHCFFGTNSTIRDNVNIGNDVIVGAGATVLQNLADETVIKAAPSKILPIDRFKLKL